MHGSCLFTGLESLFDRFHASLCGDTPLSSLSRNISDCNDEFAETRKRERYDFLRSQAFDGNGGEKVRIRASEGWKMAEEITSLAVMAHPLIERKIPCENKCD